MNIIVIPYRDQYFCQKYGCIVRDLMIVKALEASERVRRLVLVNRPVTVYERMLNKGTRKKGLFSAKTKIWDQVSLDMLGPFKKRAWTECCFQRYLPDILEFADFPDAEKNVVLDFTPIAKIDYSIFKEYAIWYDLIDNFTKHNAYSRREKDLVLEKYKIVNKAADLVTGVTEDALRQFDNQSRYVVANGILKRRASVSAVKARFDFGFLGFITDKFDLDFVQRLAGAGYSIAVYGESYDPLILKKLQSVENITLFGRFTAREVEGIMASFTIGLIPYLIEKSHDESPLKLYQYLDFGKPVIMSQAFDNFSKNSSFVHIYREDFFPQAVNFINRMYALKNKDAQGYVRAVRAEIADNVLWKNKVDKVLDVLEEVPGRIGRSPELSR